MASYGTDEGFTQWLAEQGLSLPAGAPTPAVLRARASAYIDGGYEAYLTGYRTGGAEQELAFPRTGATLNCRIAVASDLIPPAVINSVYRAAYLEAETPGILAGVKVETGKRVRRQKVDSIEREFFDDGKATVGNGPAFIDSIIDGAMGQFICDTDGAAFMWALGS